MTDPIVGLYDLEPLLVDRVRDEVVGLKTVGPSSMIDGSDSSIDRLAPLALIRPVGGNRATETDAYGDLVVDQTWSVLLVVSHVANDEESSAHQAGPIALDIVRALHGWNPGGSYGPMALDGHLDQVLVVGRATFEIRFTVPVTLTTQ